MTRIGDSGAAVSSPASSSTASALGNVDVDQFLQLMIAELQNQDPLSPVENSEMLQQITQIREIGASEALSTTLSAVLAGQNVATASALIGKEVSALTDDSGNISGVVDRVSITDDNDVRVHIGDESVKLDNVREIVGGE